MTAPDTGSFAFLTRRRVLTLGAASIAVVAFGGVGLSLLRGSAPPVSGLRVLDGHEYRTLDLLAKTLLPNEGGFPVGAEGMDLARSFDGFLADEPPENVKKLRMALRLFEYGPVLFEKKLVTFSNLSPDERLRHYQSWAESDMLLRRQVALAFRKFFFLVFYDHESVWPHIGYPGPSLLRGAK